MPRVKKTAAAMDSQSSPTFLESSPTAAFAKSHVNVASRYGDIGPTKLTTVDDISPEGWWKIFNIPITADFEA